MGPLIAAQCGLARAEPGCPPAFVPVSSDPRIHRVQAGPGSEAEHNAYHVALGKMCSPPFASGGQATSPCCPSPSLVSQGDWWCEPGCGHTAPAFSAFKLEAQGGSLSFPLT